MTVVFHSMSHEIMADYNYRSRVFDIFLTIKNTSNCNYFYFRLNSKMIFYKLIRTLSSVLGTEMNIFKKIICTFPTIEEPPLCVFVKVEECLKLIG